MKRRFIIIIVSFTISLVSINAQEETKPPDRPLTDVFESIWLIDNQTVIVPFKGTFEFDIQHRFGTWDKGYDDFWGLFAPSNFRLGFNYVPINRLQLGFGFSKENLLWDFNAKYAILEQSRSGAKPLSITYLVNMAVDTRKLEKTIFRKAGDRYSYFHQLMLARKFSDKLSLQVAANVTHFNFVDAILDESNNPVAKRENNHFSISTLGRLKISDGTAIIANVDIPVTDHNIDEPEANISFGLEFATSGHAFQVFVGNYKSTIPQYNHFFNLNSFSDNKILIGFNMTRLWSF
ncbi:MAG: hypothetical protein KJP00_12115 [Bacteroidia bacterium]|nr:hypothetical protein [Bacteroidia bacterium]